MGAKETEQPQTGIPYPGSEKALALGCTCPFGDNCGGRGAWGTDTKPGNEKVFWKRGDCPLHGAEAAEALSQPPQSQAEAEALEALMEDAYV